MEAASTGATPPKIPPRPNTDKVKRKLLHYGVYPTPKIIHNIRKKQLQKSLRKSKKLSLNNAPLNESQRQTLADQSHFQTIRREYRVFNKAISEESDGSVFMNGKPWERLEKIGPREVSNVIAKEYAGEKLKTEYLKELGENFHGRSRDDLRWVLDDDIEAQEGWLNGRTPAWEPPKRRGGEAEAIRFLVDRLSAKELSVKDWKFVRMMKQSGLQFTEAQLLKIVGNLGTNGQWRNALSVVEWVYSDSEHKYYKSRFVYTKILSVLGKARRPHEALRIFNLMREDFHVYPDKAAYHAITVTLGQAGLLKELVKIIESMRQKPKTIKNMRRKNWDPILEPDLVVYNAVLNACVPTCQWKGVSWVFEQIRKSGLKPNGASYGLAMEVMLQSGRYDDVHDLFQKMRRRGEAPNALTYKVLVRSFWKEGRIDEAVEAVRHMEQRGIVGTACVYYELACCLCNKGRWKDAMIEVEKLKKLALAKPLEVTFTGMIMSSMDAGHIEDCISIFEQMKDHCAPNIGMINAMLKVYGRNDMFSEAKELFEQTKHANSGSMAHIDENATSLTPDMYTYSLMLDVSAAAHQWEYFEHVYKDMTLAGNHLDQNKYASILVKASRAGKWHLLEHAFNATLDAGEIPHPSFFTEMICQATSHGNYERALTLINALGHAPFQVNEKQWTDLFEKSSDRLSEDCLEKLSDALANCPITEEASITNLTKSLRFFCKSGAPKVHSKSITFEGKNPNSNDDPPDQDSNITYDVSSINFGSDTEDDSDTETISEPSSVCEEDRIRKLEDFADLGVILSHFMQENSKNDGDESDLEIDFDDVSPLNESNFPSAGEILKSWMENLK